MAKQFQLQIITQEKTVFDEPVTSVTLPGEEGYFGVLADHAPLVATLGRGNLVVRQGENHVREFVIDGGFMEVLDNVAMVLVDSLTDPSAA